METKFNSHKSHNYECDIVEGKIDSDSFLTFGIHVNGVNKGKTFCEYYKGSNYVANSKLPSYSRMWANEIDIPKKYYAMFKELEAIYEEQYRNITHDPCIKVAGNNGGWYED